MAKQPKPSQGILSQLGISQESTHTLKFGGVVGKIAIVALAGFAATVGVAKYTSGYIQLVCILGALLTTIVAIRWVLDYAGKHPVSATLEGTEVVLWQQQIMLAAKGTALPQNTPVIPNPEGPPPQIPPREGAEQ